MHDDVDALRPTLVALAEQDRVAHETYEVIVVLAGCRDALRAEAVAAGDEHPELRLTLVATGDDGDAAARRTGMDLACHRLLAIGRDHGRILLAHGLIKTIGSLGYRRACGGPAADSSPRRRSASSS